MVLVTSRGTEDYLEAIYELIQEKGYARAVDIARRLNVRPPSVTEMVQRLGNSGFLIYERYRGITLTEEGERVARSVLKRHNLLFDFLTLLGVDKEVAEQDACEIEHHLHPESIEAIATLLTLLRTPVGERVLEELYSIQGEGGED
ncbi:MAG: iron (metal) dependent repressor, DtxR family [Candidatus Syntrophoarchaeum butanivorans]|uniref:Iron (Metal) dependent repressor, DtxR family n=1 Tax=Candidatus Syntropharchaeum butanivorans TaxID=1839936 RepID=A0A1F2P6F0_9EURY|nr:MAG: iron (metal) dependent repressor, DtxR family [Candidatus Syntrophoarchaeum butanivorans]